MQPLLGLLCQGVGVVGPGEISIDVGVQRRPRTGEALYISAGLGTPWCFPREVGGG